MLDEGMKLQAFQPVLAYDLALCYYQLGDRDKALEYLGKAKAGTSDPKQKQKLLQLLTFFTTGENGLPLNDSDRDRISRANRLRKASAWKHRWKTKQEARMPSADARLLPAAQPASSAPPKSTIAVNTS